MSTDEEARRGALSKECVRVTRHRRNENSRVADAYSGGTHREEDLRKAIALSEEEEARRKRELEDRNAKALFDDSQQVCVQPLVP